MDKIFTRNEIRIIFVLLIASICSQPIYSKNISFTTLSDSIVTQENSDTLKTDKKGLFTRIIEYFEESNDEKTDGKFDVSFIGGPSYSGDTKLGIGIIASGLYRIDKENFNLPPSNVSLYSNFTTSGSFSVGMEGHTIFKDDKHRFDFDMFFSSLPSKYWGIGYENGKQKENYTKFTQKEYQLKLDFHREMYENFYIGLTATAQHIKGGRFQDEDFLKGESKGNNAIGGGVILSYDTRDFIPNPFSGMFFKYEHNIYPNFLGTTRSFNRMNVTARFYQKVWKDGVIAFDANGVFNNGSVPWSMMAQVGGSRQMRGYFTGQYRDKKMLNAQVELRQRVYSRSGVALWAGAGNSFDSFDNFKWGRTLPTFGVGYRWEFKNRVNIRLDYGIGKGQSSVYFNISEAF